MIDNSVTKERKLDFYGYDLANNTEFVEENNIKSEAINHFIPHQANYRIIKAVGDALKLKQEQIVVTVAKYGNTSGASIPMAINDIYEQGELKAGELMLLDAFVLEHVGETLHRYHYRLFSSCRINL